MNFMKKDRERFTFKIITYRGRSPLKNDRQDYLPTDLLKKMFLTIIIFFNKITFAVGMPVGIFYSIILKYRPIVIT